ncbi:hypothetical protein CLV62_12577 [Dysgonomonas alginatilytica]|uniref:Uncharacterized protein n=1 Tax=Dysgonomonas alginatilytica TaxID=1605892 RepID=A0A2V3PM28_9BACT|nr:hypothetical protein [Dysgonomonas alginatilytica]PXV61244.1 hypothetical protein CLV62_12577 [Dysgonomonas alginatilytica]
MIANSQNEALLILANSTKEKVEWAEYANYCSDSKDEDTTDRDSDGDKIYPVYIKFYADDLKDLPWAVDFRVTDTTKVGKSGIIRLMNDPTLKILYAFDWACIMEWNEPEVNMLVPLTGTYDLICNKCGSRFQRFGGDAISGIAKEKNKNLKRYQVVKQSDGSWLITN